MRKIKLLALVVAASIFAVSCQKGDAGPAGPAGATGPAGPAGPAGAAGTANVIYSDWIDVTYSSSTYSGTITAAQLTSDIITKGEVKVYWNLRGSDTLSVVPLPVSNLYAGTDASNVDYYFNILPIFQVGKITLALNGILDYGISNPSTYTTPWNKKYYQYRYVLIPGGVKTTSKIDWNNYAQVKSYLHLEN
ncbi:hypothetical protein [Pinibacter soli]|uniref:Collagen-like protein n=1 Tax=Pinibacter soli TaxID=3044211 RepID=A0ABT6RH44_9BACT|nr:hypothetical protein [Pinibacter soli]MDI3321880.1 hypothetical protein [Pinibacter soli]